MTTMKTSECQVGVRVYLYNPIGDDFTFAVLTRHLPNNRWDAIADDGTPLRLNEGEFAVWKPYDRNASLTGTIIASLGIIIVLVAMGAVLQGWGTYL